MSKHSFKDWFTVTRYWSFPVSTMPVLATFAYLFSENLLPGGFKPYLVFILCLLGVVVLHSAGNVLSDWFDYKSGVDNENAFAVPNLVFHHFEPKEYLNFSIILFVAGVLIGVSIALLSGPVLWIIGVVGVLLTILFTLSATLTYSSFSEYCPLSAPLMLSPESSIGMLSCCPCP